MVYIKKMRNIAIWASVGLLALSVSGCMDANSSGFEGRPAPGPGSVFQYRHWYTYENAASVGPDTSVRSVIATGLTADGKGDVVLEGLKAGDSSSSSYISYEPNGDVSWYAVGSVSGDWERYPLSSHDTVIFVKGTNSLGNLVVDTNSFLENKDTTIEGHAWHAIKIRQIVSLDGHTYNNSILWFDSLTGWYLRMDLPPRHALEPGLSSNGEEIHVYDAKINP
jgi:hypothetical protein